MGALASTVGSMFSGGGAGLASTAAASGGKAVMAAKAAGAVGSAATAGKVGALSQVNGAAANLSQNPMVKAGSASAQAARSTAAWLKEHVAESAPVKAAQTVVDPGRTTGEKVMTLADAAWAVRGKGTATRAAEAAPLPPGGSNAQSWGSGPNQTGPAGPPAQVGGQGVRPFSEYLTEAVNGWK